MKIPVLLLLMSLTGCLFSPVDRGRVVQTEYGNLTFDFTTDRYDDALANGKPTILEFSAEWCPSCYEAIPFVEELKEDYGGRVNIMTVDFDEHPDMARGFGVASLPSFVFFDSDGRPVKIIAGAYDEKRIRRTIDELL